MGRIKNQIVQIAYIQAICTFEYLLIATSNTIIAKFLLSLYLSQKS
jgi:hypothetical protein